jgi:hypothetical protein
MKQKHLQVGAQPLYQRSLKVRLQQAWAEKGF